MKHFQMNNILEVESLEGEVCLDDTSRLDSSSEDVLLCWNIGLGWNTIQSIEVIGSRVIELVLAWPRETVLHSSIHPEAFHDLSQLIVQHTLICCTGQCEEQPSIILEATVISQLFNKMNKGAAYSSGGVGKVDSQLTHGPNDGHQALNGVTVHYRAVLLAFFFRVACFVDDLHLFYNCAFPRFSRT